MNVYGSLNDQRSIQLKRFIQPEQYTNFRCAKELKIIRTLSTYELYVYIVFNLMLSFTWMNKFTQELIKN